MADEPAGHDAPEESWEELRQRPRATERETDSTPLLDYRSPPSPPKGGTGFLSGFAGFVVGAGVIAMASFVTWARVVVQYMQTRNFWTWGWVCVGIFAVIAAVSLFARRRLNGGELATRQSAFRAGLLLGIGVTALVEGACFTITSMS